MLFPEQIQFEIQDWRKKDNMFVLQEQMITSSNVYMTTVA